ncbi:MAG: f1pep1, partial [Bacteroidetes bacterium]|nr:f1pep1 [Bacteroidota bacterium]
KFWIILACTALFACNNKHFDYPQTAKVDTVDVYFGKTIADPYRWLEDPTLPETVEWINAQNKVTFGYLSRIPFRDSLKVRLTEVWNYERYSTPLKKGEKYYFQKNSGLQNQSVLYVMDSLGAEPRIILDPNLFSQDGTVALSDYALSKDGRYLAYALSKGGSDWNEIFVKDIISGEDLADHLEWIKFSSISWYKKGFYYSRYPKPAEDQQLTSRNLNHQVYYHTLGKPQEKDILVFEDREHPDRGFYTDVTTDERFLIVYESESTYGNRVYIKSLEGKGKNFTRLNETFDYEMYIVGSRENDLYLLTNENAPRNKLVRLTYEMVSNKLQASDIIPEEDNVLEQVELAGDRIMAKYLVDAHSVIRVMDRQGKFQHDLKLPEYVNVGSMNGETGDNELFYSLASYTIPTTIYRYDVKSDSSTVLFKPAVDFNPDDYVTRLEFCTSKDGTKIPLFIVHHKKVKMNGKNPTWLYGYGGFNVSLLPRFSPARIVWLENGGIFVNANLRGGGEYGEEWHKAGIKLKKQNVFDDFIAAAEYLIRNNYTKPSRLAIAGESNGGLLIGAVINQRPDLFGVAFPGVGVMDMLRYHKFTIGWAWESDYGSVNDSAEFNYLLGYSPLHTIRKNVKYPAVLVTTADHDDRVVPAHSFKYIATLQEKYKGPNPVMIRIQTKAGHGAGKPTQFQIEEMADIWAFAFYTMHINPYAH